MSDTTSQIRKLAAEHYDEASAVGNFTTDGVTEALAEDLMARLGDDHSVTRDLIVLAARNAVGVIDKSRTREEAPTLFAAFEQPVALGDGKRLARRYLTTQHWVTHLGYVSGNAAKVNAAAAREHSRFAALATYFADDTVTTEQALVMWQTANPGKDLP